MNRSGWAIMVFSTLVSLAAAASAHAVGISILAGAASSVATGAPPLPDDLARLQARATLAAQAFERAFGPVAGTITLAVKPAGCLRVGYDFVQDRVEFCDIAGVRNAGLDSGDVIDHELFHALLCRARPELCARERLKGDSTVALHEALADFFAYTLEPDAAFGEGFYVDRPEIRPYRTDLCYSLAEGAHAKGNALVSALIARGARLSDIAQAIQIGPFTAATLLTRANQVFPACLREGGSAPSVRVSSDNYPNSPRRRYRIEASRPLRIVLEPNAAMRDEFPGYTVEWSRGDARAPDLFRVAGTDGVHFAVNFVSTGESAQNPTGVKSSEKMVADFRSADGGLLGTVPFYFSRAGGVRKRGPTSMPGAASATPARGRP